MADLAALVEDLVTANRILARERVIDSFGHVSFRHPDNPGHFLMSRARAPEQVETGDIITFTLEGKPVSPTPLPGKPYSERFIHGALYEARPEILAVVHNHSESVVPFSVLPKVKLRPLMHMAGSIGSDINIWDSRTKFGDTNLLVTSIEMGRDMAKVVGNRPVSLLRGHGCVVVGKSIREVVFTSIYLEINARQQTAALSMGNEVNFLSPGEVELISKGRAGFTLERGWENWCLRAGRSYIPGSKEMGEGFSRTDPTG
jgi:HCOMODA/2-hydroxy-3-carboxy-muconic semialdehyde decarboxylase